jgi:hypothetical protein
MRALPAVRSGAFLARKGGRLRRTLDTDSRLVLFSIAKLYE